ncbi:MAG: ABC transporter permease [Planctomycetes bacterium]|nr:ABC transporter permease [Planctomycetota bacterium]
MSRVWAVAMNTIAQGLRMKLAVIVVLLLVILLPLMGVVMIGDGTLKGKLQTFVSYGLSLTSLLLCLLTIAVSTHTLTSDIKRRQIYLVITKPVRRFEIVCGKLLGVVLLITFLLGIFTLIIYSLTVSIPRIAKADAAQLEQVNEEFFTSRETLTDPVDEVRIKEQAIEEYRRLKENRQLPDGLSSKRVLFELEAKYRGIATNVQVGASRRWVFENIKGLDPDETIFIQYKFGVAVPRPDDKVYAVWDIGDDRQLKLDPSERKTDIMRAQKIDAIRVVQEFQVPAKVVAEDGYVSVVFHNPVQNQTTVIPQDVKVLYRSGTFTANFIRSVLLILARIIFLAALGVSISTWLSFPVAILICVVVFFAGTVNGFIVDSLDGLSMVAAIFYSVTIKPILWFLPQFDGEFSPAPYIIAGESIGWLFLVRIFAVTVLLKAALLTLFGIFIFHKKEIARITV